MKYKFAFFIFLACLLLCVHSIENLDYEILKKCLNQAIIKFRVTFRFSELFLEEYIKCVRDEDKTYE